MEPIQNNMQKYENYREQMGRLKKALNAGFYLEAIFIEYAIMEDRLESILRHSGKWKESKPGQPPISLQRKKNRIEEMAREKKSLANKYFSNDILDNIVEWKDKRNSLIHALLKQSLHTQDLKDVAEQGLLLVKELSNKASCYIHAVERQQGKKVLDVSTVKQNS